MPQFTPNEEKVAIATFPVKPAGLECTAELWLASDDAKVATSGEIPFVATGVDQPISLPITMPGTEGTYPVLLYVLSNGQFIKGFRADEDVVILPVTANLLLNPGFEDGLEHWTRWVNPAGEGRARWDTASTHPYTGLRSAVFVGSIAGRSVVATLSQVIPWQNEYRGQPFQLSAMRCSFPGRRSHDIEGTLTFIIYDGVSVTETAAYVSHGSGYREQSVTKTLSPNANRLEVTFKMVPHGNFLGGSICVDDTILEVI